MSFDQNRPTTPEPFNPAAPEGSPVPTAPVAATAPVLAAPPAGRARKGSSGGRALNIILGLAAAVAIGGVAFAAGRGTAPAAAATGLGRGGFGAPGASFAPGASGAPGGLGGRGGFGGGGFGGGITLSGTVVSMTGETLTLKTAAGATVEVTIGSSTTYDTQTPATAADVQAGKTVQVQLAGGPGGGGRPTASAATSGPLGTASSVTVVP
jgi:hypothetical protein